MQGETVTYDRPRTTETRIARLAARSTLSPGAAVVVGAAAESGTGLPVEAVAIPEVR